MIFLLDKFVLQVRKPPSRLSYIKTWVQVTKRKTGMGLLASWLMVLHSPYPLGILAFLLLCLRKSGHQRSIFSLFG